MTNGDKRLVLTYVASHIAQIFGMQLQALKLWKY